MSERRDIDWAVWAGLLAIGLAWEARELRETPDGWTLSRTVRTVFRTDTALGRRVFVVALREGANWFERHILTDVRN